MRTLRVVVVVLGLVVALSAHASPNTDALSQCLTDNTSGKDRKALARWIFVGMSAHPDVGESIARASPKTIDLAQREMGALFTRLIGDQCSDQMKQVAREDGNSGIRIAFEQLGRMAMQELMSNSEVNAAMGGFERYLDKPKLDRVLKSK